MLVTVQKIKVVKNKVAPPFKIAEVDVMYGQGISQEGELLDMAVEKDIVDKSGAWYSYKEDRIGQGRENAKIYMANHPEMMAEVSALVRGLWYRRRSRSTRRSTGRTTIRRIMNQKTTGKRVDDLFACYFIF